MASSAAAQNWLYAQQVEGRLKSLMQGEDLPTYEQIDHVIKQLRIACEATIFADFEYASSLKIEQRLWDAHILINNRYRKLMDKYRKGDSRKSHVERRGTTKHYADFIKTSQFFYKGYIQRLAAHFNGMQGLRRIAHRLSLSTLSVDDPAQVSAKVEQLIELSCHATLLRLGDLSRYRNTIRTKDRSWEPALGYYALANDLCPDLGSAHNQMAVIALADGNHLNAVYHLYRALTTGEPHPLAKNNLEVEFKKIVTAWEKKTPQQTNDPASTLAWWFVLLHAKFYEGDEFSTTRQELEKEILSRMALLSKEKEFAETLEKVVIVNIAAEYFSQAKYRENNTAKTQASLFFMLGFNVQLMTVLLRTLLPELEIPSGEDIPGADGSQPDKSRDQITLVARRILPALRQYSAWLAGNAKWLVVVCTPIPGWTVPSSLAVQARELWSMYTTVLTRLVDYFTVSELQAVEYLLEEDESTVGFQPLRRSEISEARDLFNKSNGTSKSRATDPGQEKLLPGVEMQSRLLDIIVTGLALSQKHGVPISLRDNVFSFVESGMPVAPSPLPQPSTIPTPSYPSNGYAVQGSASPRPQAIEDYSVAALATEDSMDTDMERMVEDLVEPSFDNKANGNETSYGMHTGTANELYALGPIPSNGYGPRSQTTPKMQPRVSGLYNGAFTPTYDELRQRSPGRVYDGNRLSPHSLSTQEQRLAAAVALDEMTGYSGSRSGSWARPSAANTGTSWSSSFRHKSLTAQLAEGLDDPANDPRSKHSSWGGQSSRPLSGQSSSSVNQILQEQMSQQYMSISTSFSNTSSLEGNSTPPLAAKRAIGSGAFTSGTINGNSTFYPGASDVESYRRTMDLQSSIYNGSQKQNFAAYTQTPPGGQGG